MKLVDANILLYAVNSDAPLHAQAKAWLEHALSGTETVGFAWIALLAFLRLSTRTGVFDAPLATAAAFDAVDAWLAQPCATIVQPGERHARLLRTLLESSGTAGNLVSDAHLAALAIESRAELYSFDSDFERFPGLRWRNPLDQKSRR